MDSLKVVHRLKLYFKVDIIGSLLLVNSDLLPIDLINDIDVAISTLPNYQVCKAYLQDLGYVQTLDDRTDSYGRWVKGSMLFVKEGEIPIHLSIMEKYFFVWSNDKLLG